MTLFYAYLKDSTYDYVYRYLITFVDREAADEWWRFISTSPSPYANTVKRVSPQFYVQSTYTMNVVTFFTNTALPDANQFLGKMFFTWLYDRDSKMQSIAPPVKYTDHISGKWYFVRSTDDPRRHWYTRLSGKCLVCKEKDCDLVHVSTEHRTRFQVGVHSPNVQAPKNLVMIGSDDITIAASKDYILRIDDTEDLRITKVYQIRSQHLLFRFDDLKDRFVTRTEDDEDGNVICEYVLPVERGFGEGWELSI